MCIRMTILTRLQVLLVSSVLVSWCATAQTKTDQPHFEAASIKPSLEPALESTMPGLMEMMPLLATSTAYRPVPMPDPGRVSIKRISLLALISMAYRVPMTQVRGPKWVAEEVFGVEAKVPAGTGKDQVRLMLQSLVEERFGLVLHHEITESPGYALLVGKDGAKLTPGAPVDTPPPLPERRANLIATLNKMTSATAPQTGGISHYEFKGISTEQLAAILSPLAQAPVVDRTGLEGTYDVVLEMPKEQSHDSILEAVSKLGLKLAAKRVPTDTIVIDKLSRTPLPN